MEEPNLERKTKMNNPVTGQTIALLAGLGLLVMRDDHHMASLKCS